VIYSSHIRDQLKNLTAKDIISALKRDGWSRDIGIGAIQVYKKASRRVSIHYHPNKTYRNPKLLDVLLGTHIGWTVDDLVRLKLVR
jgi:predicted RNA binding protein YcfA (HicA-like mRNA interferase family)